ncbi:MAG: chemotaxis protein CheD [Syntrophorhabdaceae bacterium]|nr:chemotaxis protein CheD [Syntrophorhabdaceae bacterium]
MIIRDESHGKRVVLFPGDHYVTDKRLRISTLLGSCVSACLYDPVNRVVGMNHFLLSNKRYTNDVPIVISEAGRYGVHAMELIINGMLKLGAQRKYLKAKVCGGSSLLPPKDGKDSFHCVGRVNCRFIQEFLRNDGITIVSSDLGGNLGRVVHFDTQDYSLYIRKIRKVSLAGLSVRDKEYWKRELKRHREEGTLPDVWK